MPRLFEKTAPFKKDWKSLESSGRYRMGNLKTLMLLLIANDGPLPAEYKDHALNPPWEGYRDAHVGGDWILIYKINEADEVVFARTGTHSELFG
jgi:mRNA interferase YafQ